MKDQIAEFRKHVETLEAFSAKYADRFPPEVKPLGSFHGPEIRVWAGEPFVPNEDGHQRVIALIGEVFGRGGWTRKLNACKTHFSWVQIIDGVKVTVDDAEPVEIRGDNTPVHPTEFPLLLAAPEGDFYTDPQAPNGDAGPLWEEEPELSAECPQCGGSGQNPNAPFGQCRACKGKGEIRVP